MLNRRKETFLHAYVFFNTCLHSLYVSSLSPFVLIYIILNMVNDMAGIRSFDVSSRLVLVKTLNLNFKRDRGVNIWCVFPRKIRNTIGN